MLAIRVFSTFIRIYLPRKMSFLLSGKQYFAGHYEPKWPNHQ